MKRTEKNDKLRPGQASTGGWRAGSRYKYGMDPGGGLPHLRVAAGSTRLTPPTCQTGAAAAAVLGGGGYPP